MSDPCYGVLSLNPHLHAQFLFRQGPDVAMHSSDFLLGQRLLHAAVDDAVASACPLCLGILVLIDDADSLDEVTGNVPHKIEEVIGTITLGTPEGEILY